MNRKYILDRQAIALKLERMALEIAERNTDARRIVLAGIAPNGPLMNAILKDHLSQFYEGAVETITITLDNKRQPAAITLSEPPDWQDAIVIITDDVSNSGKTQAYAMKPFLEPLPISVQTLVLVNRSHKKFPVQPDYIGFALATTLEEYIDVEVADGQLVGAWMK